MNEALLLIAAYLIGSVPVGVLAAKARGVDIRKEGSGNIGATNVFRVLGAKLGMAVFCLDVLKGYLPALAAHQVLHSADWAMLCGLMAVVGHGFSPFLGFKGGKGIATGLGMLLGASPIVGVGGLAVFCLVMTASLVVSLSSIMASISLNVIGFLIHDSVPLLCGYGALTLFILVRHVPNMKRLKEGTEPRFGKKTDGSESSPLKLRLIFMAVFVVLAGCVWAIYTSVSHKGGA